MYQSPNVQMYQSAILGSPPYPKLCGVVIIAHYNLYQIVCSPRVAFGAISASYANHLAPHARSHSWRKYPTKGRCKYVFVCTKTLLALTQKSPQSSEKCVTTFPYRFRQEKPPTIFGRLDGLDLNLVRIGSYSYYQDALLSKPSLSPFRAFSRYPLAS